ncbi:MAG: DUF4349 domain-containing protein [Leptospiraceae bacterium]|nr:DUF4349 domain-containing protein [Leptospiraceae bacterium]
MKTIFYILTLIFLFSCSSQEKRAMASRESSSVSSKSSAGDFRGGVDNKNQPRIVTYSASLNMEVEKHKMTEIMQSLTKLIQTKEGVIISKTLNSLYFKVPGDNFFEMIVELKQIGNVVYEQVTSEDITEAYYDTKIRLENAEKFQKRYLDLLSKAKTVEESVKVEQELHRITNEIDTLKGKMNLYQNMVQYSKINVYLVERERKGPLGWVFYAAYVGIRWLFIWD